MALLVFVLAGIGTYATRSVFILVAGERTLPPLVERGLPYIGPAVLASFSASLLTSPGGIGMFFTDLPKLLAILGGIFGAWRYQRYDLSFAAALAIYFALDIVI